MKNNKGINKGIQNWTWIALVVFSIVGVFFPIIGAIALICMLAPLGFAFFRGRYWCGHFCPRGSFLDTIVSKISFNRPIPQFFKKTSVKVFFLSLLMVVFTLQTMMAWGSWTAVGVVFVRMVIVTTILAILLGIFINPRTWCTICSMGTTARMITHVNLDAGKISHVAFDASKCVNCKLCTKHCPIGIDVHTHKDQTEVNHADCLKCGICVSKCPRKALSFEL